MTNGDRIAELVRERDKVRERMNEMRDKFAALVDAIKQEPLEGMLEPYAVALKAHRNAIESLDAEISRCAANPDQLDSGIGTGEGGEA